MNISEKGFNYAIRTAEVVRYLKDSEKNFPLCERLLACGLETGMNCQELSKGETAEDILRKLALYKIKEADYIIEMAVYGGYLTELQSVHIREDGEELIKLLNATV
ncbi:four helix bundle protein [Ihubacter massiliensis]|uniref:Four helix bundle protein n=1 Tax=Hominibacterium faecale TaxID=2839743 RepID=A0A9J6QPJ0_9FIRM|nr:MULTISPECIES: four helix bundle protein [Eubacteriales Family XIII. Incertae Sedis]MCO7120856.1 four helix bundle protein [Ihubacter massiliensis]MCU7377781.1 four helix bundle protein [Hominibacterium faecale]MDE8732960.1 four helix bundle protein [Eubacteriales bacterium DFI.9.88]